MSKYISYLNTAKEILHIYRGNEPLASFLKKFFSLNKKYGSKDRKQISQLCYCYFRLGKMGTELSFEERIVSGLFLCSGEPDEILRQFKPEWNEKISLPLHEKISLLNLTGSFENIFLFANALSDGIDKPAFILSHLKQPDIFLRLRPKKYDTVKQKLINAGIDFQNISDSCLALANASKIDSVIGLNKEAVVQDFNSQKVGEFFKYAVTGLPPVVWDCCAASGGKSIMLYDFFPNIDLTVSDIRESILVNLKKRFSEAGIRKYTSIVADLSGADSRFPASGFGLILADVPCSGSGTWGRTPEQLYFFREEKISEYATLQKKIISNIIPHLQPGGHLIYITCSVFKKENEEIVDFAMQNFPLQLIKMEVLKGYDKKADTMFAAVLTWPMQQKPL